MITLLLPDLILLGPHWLSPVGRKRAVPAEPRLAGVPAERRALSVPLETRRLKVPVEHRRLVVEA